MKNVDKILSSVCLDERISDGIFNMENNDHMDVLQHHLIKRGISETNSIVYRNRMVEGKYPERQAYNANGILVTFPTPEYKQRAIARGTHFEENPKKRQTNVFQTQQPAHSATAPVTPPTDTATVQAQAPVTAPVDTTLQPSDPLIPPPITTPDVNTADGDDVDKRTPEEKSVDAKTIQQILAAAPTSMDIATKYPNVQSEAYTLKEALNNGFYEKEGMWYTKEGKCVGKKWYCEVSKKIIISP